MPHPPPPLALVTGASSGIGLELARLLARDGFHLALVARRGDRLEALGAELASRHQVACLPIVADLGRPDASAAVMAALGARADGLEIVVNNAGFGAFGEIAAMEEGVAAAMIQVNVTALTELTRLALPGLLRRGRGRIMNVASIAGFAPGPLMAVYHATKAYVVSFSVALAEEVRGTGVSVTAFCPGTTRTEFHAAPGMRRSKPLQQLMAEAAPVVKEGYDGLMAGRLIVIPGWKNRAFVRLAPLLPASLVARLVGRAQRSRRLE
jgi:uncharacterized protein